MLKTGMILCRFLFCCRNRVLSRLSESCRVLNKLFFYVMLWQSAQPAVLMSRVRHHAALRQYHHTLSNLLTTVAT
jgi:hypothetical protein